MNDLPFYFAVGPADHVSGPAPEVQSCVVLVGDSTPLGPFVGIGGPCLLRVVPTALHHIPMFANLTPFTWTQPLSDKQVLGVSNPNIFKIAKPLISPMDQGNLHSLGHKTPFPS